MGLNLLQMFKNVIGKALLKAAACRSAEESCEILRSALNKSFVTIRSVISSDYYPINGLMLSIPFCPVKRINTHYSV